MFVKQTGDSSFSLRLRNSPTNLMKSLGYGTECKHTRDSPGNFIQQEHLPSEIIGTSLHMPSDNTNENQFRSRVTFWWNEKYLSEK